MTFSISKHDELTWYIIPDVRKPLGSFQQPDFMIASLSNTYLPVKERIHNYVYMLFANYRANGTYSNITLARAVESKSCYWAILQEEIFHTQLFSSTVVRLEAMLDLVIETLCTEVVDIENPALLASRFGGTVHHKSVKLPIVSSPRLH